MVLVVSFGARVRLGPAYGGLFGVNNSPPHALTMRGMWTSAAPPTHALKEGLWEAEELWVPGAVKPQNQSRPGGGACTQMSVPKPSLARAAGKMKGEVSCLVLNFVGYDFGGYFLLPPSHLGPICSGEAGQGSSGWSLRPPWHVSLGGPGGSCGLGGGKWLHPALGAWSGGLGYPDPEVLGLRWFAEDGIISLTPTPTLTPAWG